MARRKKVYLTESQIRHLLGAIDFAETYLDDTKENFGHRTREEAVMVRALDNAARSLREGLHR